MTKAQKLFTYKELYFVIYVHEKINYLIHYTTKSVRVLKSFTSLKISIAFVL